VSANPLDHLDRGKLDELERHRSIESRSNVSYRWVFATRRFLAAPGTLDVNAAGRSNRRNECRVTIGFKTGSMGLESEAIYTMSEEFASKFECQGEK
jgi:hypothetical protein